MDFFHSASVFVACYPLLWHFFCQSDSKEAIDTRNVTGYIRDMIKSFAHKVLKDFFETGSKKGIQPDHAAKLGRII